MARSTTAFVVCGVPAGSAQPDSATPPGAVAATGAGPGGRRVDRRLLQPAERLQVEVTSALPPPGVPVALPARAYFTGAERKAIARRTAGGIGASLPLMLRHRI